MASSSFKEIRIGLPIQAKAGAILNAIGGLVVIAWVLWVLLLFGDFGVELYASEALVFGLVLASGLVFVIAATLALLRRYLVSGALTIIVSANVIPRGKKLGCNETTALNRPIAAP